MLSPFKDPIGFAIRLEGGYLAHDEVDGLKQTEGYVAPQVILQKNFLDDTLVFDVNGGTEFAWGKRPAEQYPRELAFTGGAGVSYRFAANWYFGVESHIRSEYPMFHFGNFEHVVMFCRTEPALRHSALVGNAQLWISGLRFGNRRARGWQDVRRRGKERVPSEGRIQFLASRQHQ